MHALLMTQKRIRVLAGGYLLLLHPHGQGLGLFEGKLWAPLLGAVHQQHQHHLGLQPHILHPFPGQRDFRGGHLPPVRKGGVHALGKGHIILIHLQGRARIALPLQGGIKAINRRVFLQFGYQRPPFPIPQGSLDLRLGQKQLLGHFRQRIIRGGMGGLKQPP